jgi:hypothetical protein
MEAGMIAVAVPAFLGTMGLAAYAYLADRKHYDNKHFTPCGTEPSRSAQLNSIFAATPNFSKVMPGRNDHVTTLDPVSRRAMLSYVESSTAFPAIDKPPQGVTVPAWMHEMAEAVRIAKGIAQKQIEIIQHRSNGDTHLARRAEQELNVLQTEIQSMSSTSHFQGHRLHAMASAGDGNSVGATETAVPKEDPADAAYRAQLAAALILDDCPIRATMLTGYAGEFAEFKQWDLFVSAVRFALEAAGKGLDKKQSFALKRALIIEIERAIPIDAEHMPPEAVRRYLTSMIQSEWPVAMRDPYYMKALQSLKNTVEGWTRVVQALGQQAPADKTAADQGIVEAELVPAAPVQQSKTPVVRDGGLITVAGKARTMQEWVQVQDLSPQVFL